MGKLIEVKFNGTLEIDSEDLAGLLASGEVETKAAPAKGGKASRGKAAKEEEPSMSKDDFEEIMEEFEEEFGAKELKAFLGKFKYKSVGHVDPSSFAEVAEAAEKRLESGDDEGGEEEEEEITADTVKAKVQELTKKEGKDAVTEILEDYDIKSVRSLSKLDEDDLKELYDDLCDALDD